MTTPRPSPQWDKINSTSLKGADRIPLESFKSGDANHKLAIWEPARNGIRFLKQLVFNLCQGLTERQWKILTAVNNRHIGAPYAIRFKGETVCLDYLQAVYEIDFMESCMPFSKVGDVLEIGAGYGRTCHSLLSNHDLKSYTILDLGNALALCRRYLEAVLPPEQFRKIRFIPIERYSELGKDDFDLCLNIDSFAEMVEETVLEYLSYIRNHGRLFYTKNPVGKYLDNSLESLVDEEAVRLALQSGILRDVIDIHDTEAVERQAEKFVATYAPGPDWACLAHGVGIPWSFYWQACYGKQEEGR